MVKVVKRSNGDGFEAHFTYEIRINPKGKIVLNVYERGGSAILSGSCQTKEGVERNSNGNNPKFGALALVVQREVLDGETLQESVRAAVEEFREEWMKYYRPLPLRYDATNLKEAMPIITDTLQIRGPQQASA